MQFLTIKQEAALGIVKEHHLREMLKRNELPGVYAGTRFYINHDMLIEKMSEECRRNGEKKEA